MNELLAALSWLLLAGGLLFFA
ncbi:MAG TPA: cation:proton antiporter, partial [Pseudomonas sp.]|nr:cation:proton antiporter [Pseudomonas sp.]